MAEIFAGLARPKQSWSCQASKRPPPEVHVEEQVISNWWYEHTSGVQLLVGTEGLQSVWATVGALGFESRRLQKDFHQVMSAKSQRDDVVDPWVGQVHQESSHLYHWHFLQCFTSTLYWERLTLHSLERRQWKELLGILQSNGHIERYIWRQDVINWELTCTLSDERTKNLPTDNYISSENVLWE